MNILVSSLGLNKEIVEEALGLFNYSEFDLYSEFPTFEDVVKLRKDNGLTGHDVDEVWLVATDKQHFERYTSTIEDFDALNANAAKFVVKYRLFMLDAVADIVSEKEVRAYHNLVLKVVAYAHQQKGVNGKVFVSLACGRKTMSADLQDAAYCFGCDMLMHVLGDQNSPILPVLLGDVMKNEALTLTAQFEDIAICREVMSDSALRDIEEQKKKSQHFYTTFYLEHEDRLNFPILYTLPPSKIEQLKNDKFGVDPNKEEEELLYLRRLPKTDLHCHLGGVLSPSEMIEVAKCYIPEIEKKKVRNKKYADWLDTLRQTNVDFEECKKWKVWSGELAKNLGVHRSMVVAPYLLLYDGHPELLESVIYEGFDSDLKFIKIGMNPYEALGDLQGSGLLCNESALRKTINILLENCRNENVNYLEIRCSPLNYDEGSFTKSKVMETILEEIDKEKDIKCSVILIASRHGDESKIQDCLDFADEMRGNELFDKYFRGFDLAGYEKAKRPEAVRPFFLNAMRECYNITIHAGETDRVESVWQAVYELSAERIGHGLTLTDNKDLMNKFLERNIGIEMCPSSNYQIVGFQDNYYSKETRSQKLYPMREYLDMDLKVSVNTDDPGISKTNITREYLKAARLTPGGLSKWDILQLIYNGFCTAFFPYKLKKNLIRKAEECLADLIQKELL